MQDTNETPVVFRASRRKDAEITAVFPCEPATLSGSDMSCYVIVGQHGACSRGWYNTTRAATPDEFASLVRELEDAPFGYRLKIYRRIQPWMRAAFDAEQNRLRKRTA